jgi:hypothetical protein
MLDLGYSEDQIRELYELSEEQYQLYKKAYDEKPESVTAKTS